ncbi:MAG: acyl-CoA dehydrogenase [Rhodospirillaceae bacterium]|jgi:alkylation response protein AidB-like acyl-CoA dehydrogenase|nr:acyl-CoA dehydrogenase [Rhodospirillaceae bacterium]MBT4116981.1 acyl-CoA dehydrogenase [Rhodospirillaceae bacterium]MBT4672206.1 acyl-CoA dehydrogenase [Rhodospirillaceae bacterium]MBT4749597.1 acyl-CoA dehydrogenase [Rhodospirillaceae bacterium]MBT5178679.1 acyl-CoA dehydrogenase [Rhodospirillaceae bacterium]
MNAPPVLMTEERRLIKETARNFAINEILPLANKLDPIEGDIPAELIQKMADLGFFGILIAEEFGGMGLGAFEYCIVAEELSRAWMSAGTLPRHGSWIMGTETLADDRRRDILSRAAKGEFLSALAMSEPQTGSDVSNIQTRARRDGSDWLITGNKYWCTYADGADCIIVIARTEPELDPAHPHRGLTALMVEKPRGEFVDGLQGTPIPKIGYFGWKTWELAFDNVRVPQDAMLGQEGRAFYLMAESLELGRAHTAARSIGLARGALEDSIAYAGERQQFGRPIAEFQAIRFKIAQMATEIEAAEALLHRVCTAIDSGRRSDTEAAMVKYFAAEMAERVTSEAIQIHGGAGYTKHHQVERYWRDARLTKIFEGTSEIQQRIISDNLLGRARD